MSSQSTVSSAVQISYPLSVHIPDEECPSCGQVIPPEKIEEVKGKIASKDRERALTITTELESRFQRERAEQVADWNRSLNAAAEARRQAEEGIAVLQAQLIRVESDKLLAVETAKTEGKREGEELAASRLAEAQKAHDELETALKARVQKAEAAAEEARAATVQAVNTAVASKLAEVQKTHNELEADLKARVQKAEADSVAANEVLRKEQAASEEALTAANAATAQATIQLDGLKQEQARALEEQREALERDKANALNVQAAKAFEEHQKLTTKVGDLTRALEKKSNEELGEGAEIDLYEALRSEFPDDRIARVKRGEPGGDIIHVVVAKGHDCGTIIYDSKNHKSWRTEHVSKLKADQLAANAEHAILSTHKFPQGTGQLHMVDGVVLANPARVVLLAKLIRTHLMRIHGLQLSSIERDSKTEALYKFITSEQCSLQFERVGSKARELLDLQEKEIKWHKLHWAKQGETVRVIEKTRADLENEIAIITGTAAEKHEHKKDEELHA